jgi:gluconolactonase
MSSISIQRISFGLDHPEGLAIADADTIWCGGEAGQVYITGLGGEVEEITRFDGDVLGIALDAHGAAHCIVHGSTPGVYRVERNGRVTVVSRGTSNRPSQNPNHPLFLPDGSLLFTESGTFGDDDGCIYRVSHEGETVIANDTCRHYPNGLALSPASAEIYVVESSLPGVSAVEIRADGSLGSYRVVCTMPACVPDGIAFDRAGRALVSCWAPDAIYLVGTTGRTRELLHDPLRQFLISPSNVAFIPGTSTVVAANVGNRFLSVFQHDTVGADLVRPDVSR